MAATQHDEMDDHTHGETGTAVDPVCGMHVDPAAARDKGLHHRYRDRDYVFCGKGCYLDFRDDPERILDPSYEPSM